MTQWIKWGYLVVVAVWLGSIIFFSFVVAPTIFKVLKPADAASLQRALFPKYYLVGLVCAAAGIVCVGILLGAQVLPTTPAVLSLLLLAGCGATNLWMRQAVVPQMVEIRQQVADARAAGRALSPELEKDWNGLHRLSVQINGGVLLCGLALLYLLVYSRAL